MSLDEEALADVLNESNDAIAKEDVEMSQEDEPKKFTRKRKRPMELLEEESISHKSPEKEEIEDEISQSNITNEPLASRISRDE